MLNLDRYRKRLEKHGLRRKAKALRIKKYGYYLHGASVRELSFNEKMAALMSRG